MRDARDLHSQRSCEEGVSYRLSPGAPAQVVRPEIGAEVPETPSESETFGLIADEGRPTLSRAGVGSVIDTELADDERNASLASPVGSLLEIAADSSSVVVIAPLRLLSGSTRPIRFVCSAITLTATTLGAGGHYLDSRS
jgi:hypothetical protein